jgi:hypothetical protein
MRFLTGTGPFATADGLEEGEIGRVADGEGADASAAIGRGAADLVDEPIFPTGRDSVGPGSSRLRLNPPGFGPPLGRRSHLGTAPLDGVSSA